MAISVGHLDGVVRGTVAACRLFKDRSASGQPDVYQFELEGSDRNLTISLFPDERSPEVNDSVLIFLHPEFPNHCARLVYDVPENVV